MEKSRIEVFYEAKYHPELRLSEDIWRKISSLEARRATFQSWAYGLVGLLSLVAFIPMVRSLTSEISSSGFYEYISLAFSDSTTILVYWKEFILSVADSLPVTSLILSGGLLFVFLLSLKRFASQFKIHQLRTA